MQGQLTGKTERVQVLLLPWVHYCFEHIHNRQKSTEKVAKTLRINLVVLLLSTKYHMRLLALPGEDGSGATGSGVHFVQDHVLQFLVIHRSKVDIRFQRFTEENTGKIQTWMHLTQDIIQWRSTGAYEWFRALTINCVYFATLLIVLQNGAEKTVNVHKIS